MKALYFALALLAFAGLCCYGAAAPTILQEKESYARTHPGSAARGAAVYQRLGCAACHGPDGDGSRVAPPLAGLGGSQSKHEIIASILRPDERIVPGFGR